MQTSYGCIFLKKTSVAAINITLGVPGQRADKISDAPGLAIVSEDSTAAAAITEESTG